jgi:hypothetical protein
MSLPLSLPPLRFRLRFGERSAARSLYEFRNRRSSPRDGLPYMVVPSFFAIFADAPAPASLRKKSPTSSVPSPHGDIAIHQAPHDYRYLNALQIQQLLSVASGPPKCGCAFSPIMVSSTAGR